MPYTKPPAQERVGRAGREVGGGGAREHVERALAHRRDERARAGGVEDVERAALAARVLERVVHVVEARVGRRARR